MRLPNPRQAGVAALLTLAMALAASLTACASAAPIEVTDPPTLAPEQSIGEACAVSRAEVDAITEEVKDRLDALGKQAASGEIPSLDGLVETVTGSLDRIAEGVTNPEALDAVDKVRTEVEGLGTIKAPDSLLGVAGYLGDLMTQLGKIQSAGKALQQLCNAG